MLLYYSVLSLYMLRKTAQADPPLTHLKSHCLEILMNSIYPSISKKEPIGSFHVSRLNLSSDFSE